MRSGLWIVCFLAAPSLLGAQSRLFEVEYEPKVCLKEPCPQYKLISRNGEPAKKPLGVVTPNLNLMPLGVRSGARLMLKGEVQKEDGILELRVKDWFYQMGKDLSK